MSQATPKGERLKERRVHRRAPVEGLLVWSDEIKGRVLDLSTTGMAISTSCELEPGQYVSFRVVGERWSIVSGEVRWTQINSVRDGPAGDSTKVYHVGLALLHEPHWLPSLET